MARYTCAVGAITVLSLAASLYLPGARGHGPESPTALDDAVLRLPPAVENRTARATTSVTARPVSPAVHWREQLAAPSAGLGTSQSTVASSVQRTPPVTDEHGTGYRIAALPVAPEQIRRQLADGSVEAIYDVPLPLDLSPVLAEPQGDDESNLSDPLEDGPWLTAPETTTGVKAACRGTTLPPELAEEAGASFNGFQAEFGPAAVPLAGPPLPIEGGGVEPPAATAPEGGPVEQAEPLVAEPDPVAYVMDWQRDRELAAVSAQVDALLGRAFSLAEKGALYSARAEFFQALHVVSRALDTRFGMSCYTQALNDGLVALREARDFAGGGSSLTTDTDVVAVIAKHRTRVCKQQAATLTAVAAMQRYYAYAEERFTIACGRSPAASHACYGLGKVYTALAEQSPLEKLNGPQAMVFHQIATGIDPANYRAANELGVLLARFGQLPEARAALQQSVAAHPLPETWHNLMVVHQRLGEHDLAQRARNEWALTQPSAVAGSPNAGVSAQPIVQWVEPSTFAQSLGYDPQSAPPGMAPVQRTAVDANRAWTR